MALPHGSSAPPGSVSAVIPTRDRPESLDVALGALARQTRRPDEVVVVDAGDPALDTAALVDRFPDLPLCVLHTDPGVCAQRNAGVARATGSWILLCDDDLEPPPDYVESLLAYAASRPDRGALSGLVCDVAPDGRPHDGRTPPSFRHLLGAWLTQTTVWADVDAARAPAPWGWLLGSLKRRYRRRGNGWTRAGWPLVTQVGGDDFDTAFYGLGAALVRRDWLVASPFDEGLGPHGIGDHYGVALGFPGARPISVLTALRVVHHRATTHRLDPSDAHLLRALALHRFVRGSERFGPGTVAWLVWSLLGKAVLGAVRGRLQDAGASLKAAAWIATGRNPLDAASSSVARGARP